MIKISETQMRLIDKSYFLNTLERFIVTRCKNQKLLTLLSEREKLHSLWDAHWESAWTISEHDCALLLVLVAVWKCEGAALKPVEAMPAYVKDQEVEIKQYISGRGYFRFSDFDFNLKIEG